MLDDILEERKIKPSVFYRRAGIDRRIYWNMMNLPRYHPSKETAVACAMALEMNRAETEQLLGAAGYALSMSITWDAVIIYCIEHKYYDLHKIDEILYELGECTFHPEK